VFHGAEIILLEKLTVSQLIKTCPTFYETKRVNIEFTEAHLWN
jgi:hypothetical protein